VGYVSNCIFIFARTGPLNKSIAFSFERFGFRRHSPPGLIARDSVEKLHKNAA
jgi:hypothetical protein